MCMRMASDSSTTSAADRSVLRLRGREEGTRVSAPARVTAAGAPRPGVRVRWDASAGVHERR